MLPSIFRMIVNYSKRIVVVEMGVENSSCSFRYPSLQLVIERE